MANPGGPGYPEGFCARVGEGGTILQLVRSDRGVYACALGGAEGTTLFMLEAKAADPKLTGTAPKGNARIRALEVTVGRSVGGYP